MADLVPRLEQHQVVGLGKAVVLADQPDMETGIVPEASRVHGAGAQREHRKQQTPIIRHCQTPSK